MDLFFFCWLRVVLGRGRCVGVREFCVNCIPYFFMKGSFYSFRSS